MRELLCLLATLYVVALLVRIVLSWFPLQQGGLGAQLFSVLARITDPVLQPVRRVLPPIGMIDMSAIVVLLVMQIVVINLILGCRGGL